MNVIRFLLCCCVGVLCFSCPQKATSTAPAPPNDEKKRVTLHVSLPDLWLATAVSGGLEAGPEGRVVVSMQSNPEKMPEITEVVATLEDEKVNITLKESDATFVGVQYLVQRNGSAHQAFVAFKSLEGRVVRCASGAASGADEVVLGYEVCRSLTSQ